MLQEINCTINNTTDINCTNTCFTEYPTGPHAIQCHLQLNNSPLSHRLGLPRNPVTPYEYKDKYSPTKLDSCLKDDDSHTQFTTYLDSQC